MRIFLVILFLVASCTGTEEEAMIEMMEEEGIIAPVDPGKMEEEVGGPMEEEVGEPVVMEPEILEPAPQPPALPPSDLPETPTVNQIDMRAQINEVVRDFPPAVLMMEDPPFTVPGGEYYKEHLYCVKLDRIDTGINCFEPVLYINDSSTSDTMIPRPSSYINEDTERSKFYFSPYNETEKKVLSDGSCPDGYAQLPNDDGRCYIYSEMKMDGSCPDGYAQLPNDDGHCYKEDEEVHFFIVDQESAPDECYPYRYTFSIEEITAGDEC